MNSDLNKIAVIGMACRFPGSSNIDEYWNNLIAGHDTIKHFTNDELQGSEFNFEELRNNPDFVPARGVLSDIDKFDADFFGMTPKEAAGTDPQHRVWLETAWDAFENAGCDPIKYKGSIGVFAGAYVNTYLLNNILRDNLRLENYIRLRSMESYQLMTGNDVAFIPTKTAYKFNLKGPAINVQTACSTSLVAISQACQSLFSFESDICLAGGICIMVPQETGYLYQEGAIPSPDGKCRPFDAKAKGTVFSNGVGVVVLKRTEDAIRDKDTIYALVRGWALNNDGSNKVSYVAPGIEGQTEVIMMAQSFAEVSPDQIGYIEAHGTATPLGDPVELTALKNAFSKKTDKKQFCGVGSVKSNIGHTDAAAGVASFIKASLSVYHRIIPPTLNFSEPNPHFDFKNSPFYVQDKLQKWDKKEPLIAGISSFGIGGTNAHVIIEEPPIPGQVSENVAEWPELLILSAKSGSALTSRKKDLLSFIEKNPAARLKDIAYTLQVGRNHMQYRNFGVASLPGEVNSENNFVCDLKTDDRLTGIAFMFSGQGSQYPGMGQQLYNTNEQFRHILDYCFGIVKSETELNLKEILFNDFNSSQKLNRTDITQPALFIIEYALAKVYESLGIKPKYLIGHSIGEYAAACISGVFDLDTALKIVINRGRLMQGMSTGSMMAVRCSKEKLESIGNAGFEIAANNARNQCTISFKATDAEAIKSLLDGNEIKYILLNTSHAFHSSAFDPILNEFSHFVNLFRLNEPKIPMISCLTGDFITPQQAVSGDYWAQQLRNMVCFREGISTIAKQEDVLFLEIGPDTHLTGLARQNSDITNRMAIVSSLGKKDDIDERNKIISSLGYIWANGININFESLHLDDHPCKISLPTYPFERKRYWIDYIRESQADSGENHSPARLTDAVNLKTQNGNILAINELKELLIELSGYPSESIKDDVRFENMGFDSLFLTQYAQKVGNKFKIRIEFRQLASEYPTLKELAGIINQKVPAIDNNQKAGARNKKKLALNNLVKFQPYGDKDPLIILHGQNADKFIPEYLGVDQPYYGYLHPGSDGEEVGCKTVEELAGAYLDQLLALKPKGPYYLGGFSFGGVLAFEMAKQLQKMGHEVPFVLLFDSFSCREPFFWHNNILKIIKSNILVPPVMKVLRFVKYSVCKGYIMLNKPTPIGLRSFYIINNYFRLIKNYKPGKFKGKVVLFRALENHSPLKYLGWEKHIDDLRLIPLKGGHLTILKHEESIKTIQAEIGKLLNFNNEIVNNEVVKQYEYNEF